MIINTARQHDVLNNVTIVAIPGFNIITSHYSCHQIYFTTTIFFVSTNVPADIL